MMVTMAESRPCLGCHWFLLSDWLVMGLRMVGEQSSWLVGRIPMRYGVLRLGCGAPVAHRGLQGPSVWDPSRPRCSPGLDVDAEKEIPSCELIATKCIGSGVTSEVYQGHWSRIGKAPGWGAGLTKQQVVVLGNG